jgi:hypothetical protein
MLCAVTLSVWLSATVTSTTVTPPGPAASTTTQAAPPPTTTTPPTTTPTKTTTTTTTTSPEAPSLFAAPTVRRVLVLDVEAISVSAEDAAAATRVVAAAAGDVRGVEVVTAVELRRLAALEAERSAAGCTDESCLAEIAGALGAENVLFGSMSKLGATTTVTLSLFDTKSGRTERASLAVTDLGGLAPKLRTETLQLLSPGASTTTSDASGVRDDGPWLTTAMVGGVGVLAGAAVAGGAEFVLRNPKLIPADARPTTRLVGLAGVGAAALGALAGSVGLVVWGVSE